MMKDGIGGLRPCYKHDKQSALRTSVGGAQAAIEFKIVELEQTHDTIFHVNWHGLMPIPKHEISMSFPRRRESRNTFEPLGARLHGHDGLLISC